MGERIDMVDQNLRELEKDHAHVRGVLDAHLQENGRLHDRILKCIDNLQASLQRVHGRIDKVLIGVGGTVGLLLLAIIGWMLTNWGPWLE
jgi:hypothetical protein